MSNQNYETGGTARSIPEQKDSKEASSTSRLAKSAMDSAQRVGSEAASTITGQVKALLDEKVGDGANRRQFGEFCSHGSGGSRPEFPSTRFASAGSGRPPRWLCDRLA